MNVEDVAEWINKHGSFELNQALQEHHGKIIEVWCVDDVTDCAEQTGLHISEEQAKEVLSYLTDIGADVGINWDTIHYKILYTLESEL